MQPRAYMVYSKNPYLMNQNETRIHTTDDFLIQQSKSAKGILYMLSWLSKKINVLATLWNDVQFNSNLKNPGFSRTFSILFHGRSRGI
jgi:hypothetical protein